VRDYLYIDDCVDGYLAVAEYTRRTHGHWAFNLAGGEPISVLGLVKLIQAQAAHTHSITVQDPIILGERGDGEIPEQVLDCLRAKSVLGWSPKFSLTEGIDQMLARVGHNWD
jgi:CDP-glucose 4,6-dehydratase